MLLIKKSINKLIKYWIHNAHKHFHLIKSNGLKRTKYIYCFITFEIMKQCIYFNNLKLYNLNSLRL